MRSWNPSRGVRLGWVMGGVSCLGALLALSVYARDSTPAVVASEPVVETAGEGMAPVIGTGPLGLERLARHGSAAPRPVSPGRSPFRFGGAVHGEAAAAQLPVAPRAADAGRGRESVDSEPPAPVLVGIVTATLRSGAARTAVFTTSAGTIEFGRVGELVDGARYRLSAIDADSVTLVDAVTGETTGMRMR